MDRYGDSDGTPPGNGGNGGGEGGKDAPRRTERLSPDGPGIARAAELLARGDSVAFPTETVYGLGADARQAGAVAGIYAAKGRPSFNPLIVHVADMAAAERLVTWSDQARRLAEAFWPGPLTLVLPLAPGHGIASLVTAGLPTLALRMPAGDVARRLLRAFDGPVAAPSANPSGRISPTRADHVLQGLDGRIAGVLDGGACGVGVESTILAEDAEGAPVLLRPGGLAVEPVEALLGRPVLRPQPAAEDPDRPSAPGQLLSHYAPRAAVRLNATEARPGEILLGFGPVAGDLSLSPSGDPVEAAARLFDHLHQLDATGRPIAVAPIPQTGLGAALNDRLQRAAAPRDG
ncbi:L-threonylcarbamoyladenylate synthase [Marinibacterium sp. SX1]|uniref:L-threonylcarbamoyladenylate synthase n=1 Tax=Marinibacterium sp. SX1 TaxID=3388424 RepID=UPI003D176ABC